MAIRQFSVGPLRGLRHAAASNLGNLVVLAGPNGSGKSTLLELLRLNRGTSAEPGTRVMFVGPHRTWRSSTLNKMSMYGFPMDSYGALLESDNLPSYTYFVPQGLQGVVGTHRDAGSAEEAPAFVKTSVGRLRDKQHKQVTAAYESHGGHVPAGVVPDLLQPFRRLIETLLPHLVWHSIDDSNDNDVRVLFRQAGHAGPVFDIDQLSSGEKAAIALLLPLVERQVDQLVTPALAPPGIVPVKSALGRPAFALLVAAQPAAQARASRFADPTLDQIRLFFPAELARLLREAGEAELADRCQSERDAWSACAPLPQNRQELRGALFAYGRGLPDPQREPLLELATQIGTP